MIRPSGLLAIAMIVLAAPRLSAQDNYEIQVYGADLVPAGATMFELHSNFTSQSGVDLGPGQYSTFHAEHETLEITHGFSDIFELGYYNFTTTQPGIGFNWVGTHLRPRFSAPARWHLPVGLSISQEFGYQKAQFSPDVWTYELRPIIDQHLGRFYWAVNPALEYSFKGEAAGTGAEFSPGATIGFDATRRLNVAFEYYGSYGPVSHLQSFNQTEQELFPAINYDFGPDWEFNLAMGIALTHHTDVVGLKMIIGRRVGMHAAPK
ncbi:MAG TPA: hypothetical protein VHW65_06120 [Gemmatimonadales bacterium]|nr:hypothetical protein [Gemmatimonadales bacterium]